MGCRLPQLGQHRAKLVRLGPAHRDTELREIDLSQERIEIVSRPAELLARALKLIELGGRQDGQLRHRRPDGLADEARDGRPCAGPKDRANESG